MLLLIRLKIHPFRGASARHRGSCSLWSVVVVGSRLEWLGYKQDARPIQQTAATRANLPDRIYTLKSQLQFIADYARLPARARMMKDESGFDFSQWKGLEDLGYRLDKTIVPRTPPWFPFDWMPAMGQWRFRRTVLIYTRS